jgi:hypothetical protein
VNTLGGSTIRTNPEVADAIAGSLTEMLNNTFPAYNIIVFDDRSKDQMRGAGYNLRDEQGKYRIASASFNTTLNGIPVSQQESSSALWGSSVDIAGENRQLTAIMDHIDYLINVPVLKDHSRSGISFSLKNLYGITDIWNKVGSFHDTSCSPAIPALCSAVRNKINLIVGDAIIADLSGGPESMNVGAMANTIIVGTDPVAMDTWAMKTINKLRKIYAPRLPMVSWSHSTNPDVHDARHIWDAATWVDAVTTRGLGSTNCVVTEVTVA